MKKTFFFALAFLFPSIFSHSIFGQLLSNNPRNDFYVTNGTVYTMAQANGSTYIGGNFTRVMPYLGRGVAIDTSTGNFDSDFPKVNGIVRAVVPDGSGGWYIGGEFTNVGGTTLNRLARIQSDKTVDATWNPNVNGTIRDMALDAGTNTLYIAGDFTSVGGAIRNRLAAISTTTGNVTAFENNTNGNVQVLHLSGTTLYTGGAFTSIGGIHNDSSRNYLAAINLVTGLVSPWKPAVTGTVYSIASRDTFVYAGGDFLGAGGQTRQRIAEFSAITGNVTSWTANANSVVYSVSVADSFIYLGGNFTTIGGQTRNYIARVYTTGVLSPWRTSANGLVYKVLAFSNKVYIAGQFTGLGSSYTRNRIACLPATVGSPVTFPTSWDPNLSAEAYTMAISGSTIYTGGSFTSAGAGFNRRYLAAINSSTGEPTDWNPITSDGGIIYSMEISGTNIYVAGAFTDINGNGRGRLAAFDITSGNLLPWNPNTINNTVKMILLSDSLAYIGGSFSTIGGVSRNRIAAVKLSDGSLVSWNPAITTGSEVLSIAVFDTLVYFGGNFTAVNSTTRNRLAAVKKSDGSLITSWNPNVSGTVNSISVDAANNRMYIGGAFTNVGGTGRNRIAAITLSTGALVSGWNPNSDNTVNTIVQRGDELFTGGAFTNIGGQPRSRLASLDKSTGNANSWNPVADNTVESIVSTDSLVGVGGTFLSLGSEGHNNFVAFSAPAAPVVVRALRDTSFAWNTGTHSVEANLYNVFNDADSPTLTFSASLQNGDGITVAVVGNALQITTKPDSLGSYNILVTATDEFNQTASDVVNVTIYRPNESPYVQNPISDALLDEDFPQTFIARLSSVFKDDFGGSPLAYGATLLNGQVTPFISQDTLYLLSNENFNGAATVEVTAHDGEFTARDTFLVTVNPVNDPPSVASPITNVSFPEDFGQAAIADLNDVFSDIDNTTLTFGVSESGSGVTADIINDSLYINSTLNFNGQVDIYVTASDGEFTARDTFTVTVTPVNDPPSVATPITNVSFPEDFGQAAIADLNDVFSDIDNTTLTFGVSESGSGVTADIINDSLYINSTLNFNGQVDIYVTASDGEFTARDTFTVTVTPVNDPPSVASPIDDVTKSENFGRASVADLENVFDDIDNVTLTFGVSESGSGVTADIINDSLYINSTLNFNGQVDIYVTASDGEFTARDTFIVTVSPVNSSPYVAAPIVNVSYPEDFGGTFIADLYGVFTDPDNVTLTFGVSESGSGVTADIINDSLYINSTLNFNGQVDIYVSASDGEFTVYDTFTVTVTPVNDPPMPFALLLPADGDTIFIQTNPIIFTWNTALDPDGDPLTYDLYISGPSVDTVITGISDTTLSYSDLTGFVKNSDYNWWVIVSDGEFTVSSTDTFSFYYPDVISVKDDLNGLPVSFTLFQNYPNPFNPTTTIRFALPEKTRVILRIYNMLGQEIRTLMNSDKQAGYHTLIWNGMNNAGHPVASGVYVYTIEAGTFRQARKMLLLK